MTLRDAHGKLGEPSKNGSNDNGKVMLSRLDGLENAVVGDTDCERQLGAWHGAIKTKIGRSMGPTIQLNYFLPRRHLEFRVHTIPRVVKFRVDITKLTQSTVPDLWHPLAPLQQLEWVRIYSDHFHRDMSFKRSNLKGKLS